MKQVTGECKTARYRWLGQSLCGLGLMLCSAAMGACTEQRDEHGQAIYTANHCATCHADSLGGKPNLGPPLVGLSSKWKDAQALSHYLADPQGYREKDPRLSKQQAQYTMKMPQLPLSDDDRERLAKWLLKQ